MSQLRNVVLLDSLGDLLLTLKVRDIDTQEGAPLRNWEGVQPPGSTVQGVFGSGIYQAGVLERDFAFCDAVVYDDNYLALAALQAALAVTKKLSVNLWELPIAEAPGIVEWSHLMIGLRARIRFVPASALWTLSTDGTKQAAGLL